MTASEGSLFKDKYGYWTWKIAFTRPDGSRAEAKKRSKDKGVVLRYKLDKLKELRERGTLVTGAPTVKQYLTEWLVTKATQVRPNTMTGYRTCVNKHIIPAIGSKKLDRVTVEDVRKVSSAVLRAKKKDGTPLSPTTALQVHRVLASAYTDAIDKGLVTYNPAKDAKAPTKDTPDLEALEPHEAIQLLRHIGSLPNADDSARFAAALLTGARRGEIIGLEADRIVSRFDPFTGSMRRYIDVQWQLTRILYAHGCDDNNRCGWKRGADCPRRTINVPRNYRTRHVQGGLYLVRPKSESGRRLIPLMGLLEAIIDRQLEKHPTGLLFTRPDGSPHDPDQHSREWRELFEGAGIDKRIRLHDLRHTAITLHLALGTPAEVVQIIAGHSTIAQTLAYAAKGHADPRLHTAMQSLNGLVTPRQIAS